MKQHIFAALFAPTLVSADISVAFYESAPKDRFVIKNDLCTLDEAVIIIDLATAPAGLIFDVTASGAGVEVFQPVRVEGNPTLDPLVLDGDQKLEVRLPSFGRNQELIITADIDDTLENSDLGQIRVSGAEIAGTRAAIISENGAVWGAMDERGKTTLTGSIDCLTS